MRLLILAGLFACAAAGPATARLTELRVLAEEPFAEGAAFGDAGPYVRIRATAHGELDPSDPANAGIALLDKAPRNGRGLVEYSTDVFILRPADPGRGSGVLLYDVTNRGNKFLMSWVNDARELPTGTVNDPRSAADAGNAFTFRRGWTMVWSGWQPEAATSNNGMAIQVPVATDGPNPIIRRIRHEFVNGTRGPEGTAVIGLPYRVADTDTARLQVRSREADVREDVPRDAWGFRDSRSIQLLPAGTPPAPRRIYELTYDAIGPTVNGIGFAATRDLVAYLRQRDGVRHTMAVGISLSGRYLRHFLDLGMNRDEDGRRVFDGVLPHISGAGKVFANEAFAMPFRTATQHEDRFFPEVWGALGYGGGPGGSLLHGDGSDPVVIESNTSTEYWQKAASLVHGNPDGTDAALPEGVRAVLVAGVQHGGHAGTAATPGFCAGGRNPASAGPALRAMLVNLENWVVRGTPPPPSLVPRVADGTGVAAASVERPAVAGVIWAPGDNQVGQPVDWVRPPGAPVRPFRTFVAALDADGNERAGLRLPHVVVPLGTFTGVSVYQDMPTELCDRDGMYVPFARTRAEREQTGDPRPSLEERYGSRAGYVERVRAAGAALVAGRWLLPEDAERYVADAERVEGF